MTVGYYTVVYRVEGDAETHNAWWQTVQPLFMADDSGPVSVTAISKADEVTRLGCIEHVVERRDGSPDCDALDEIRELLVHNDPLAWWKENAEGEAA